MSAQLDWIGTESEELTSSQEGFRARISVSQESEQDSQENDPGCGPSYSELSLRFDPVGQSLRMFLGLELSALTLCSLTWQEQTTPLGRWWWVLSMPEPPTDGSGFGLLQTPSTGGMDGGNNSRKAARKRGNFWSMLPTSTVSSGAQTAENPTPGQTGGTTLEGWARSLPTPQSRDWKGPSGRSMKGEEKDLPKAVSEIFQDSDEEIPRLNPCFVEAMMGYPIGWTEVE